MDAVKFWNSDTKVFIKFNKNRLVTSLLQRIPFTGYLTGKEKGVPAENIQGNNNGFSFKVFLVNTMLVFLL